MTNITTFIATTGNDLVRATLTGGSKWSVETLLRDKGISCLAKDPGNPDVIYIGTKNQGIWCSEDFGLTWHAKGLSGRYIKSIAVNMHDSNIIYAGIKPALMFISMDRGNTWTELKGFRYIPHRWWWFSPAEPPDIRPYVIAIAPSPSEPEVLLAGIEFGAVVRSDDNGQSWSPHLHGALRDCHSLKFHSTNGNYVYQAGGTGGGAAFSLDGGHTFQREQQGIAKDYGIVCASDSADPETWYICVASSPFRAFGKDPETYLYRNNGDNNWKPIGWTQHPLPATPTVLETPQNLPGYLYAGLTNGEVWYTTDYGENWEKLPFNLQKIWFNMLVR